MFFFPSQANVPQLQSKGDGTQPENQVHPVDGRGSC